MTQGLEKCVIRILHRNGTTIGTGFVVSESLAVTCAHVIEDGGGEKRGEIQIQFYGNNGKQTVKILHDNWSDQSEDDVAFLRLINLPEGVTPVRLGSSSGRMGHRFTVLGFPAFKDRQNHWAQGNLADVVKVPEPRRPLLQLQGDEILRGMSGAPVLDVDAGVVVGMISEYINQDFTRFAYATTSETIRSVCSELVISDICPYRGLAAFSEEDTQFYFGREGLINTLLGKLRQNPRCLAIFGPSGSGKSSLVKAGLIPRIRQGDIPGSSGWSIQITRPVELLTNDDEFKEKSSEEGATLFSHETTFNGSSTRSLLIIDQFEELFVEPDAILRQEFLQTLIAQIRKEPLFTVILIMRNEFYGRLAEDSPELMELITQGIINVPLDMTEEDWRSIILGPAKIVDLGFEDGLVDRIITDIYHAVGNSRSDHHLAKATLLPLIEFALFQLWENRDDGWMTLNGYKRIGNVAGSLSQRADETITKFNEDERKIAERILTDLVHLGDEKLGIPDSRQRRMIDGFFYERERREVVQGVIERLADAHLIIVGGETSDQPRTVELIHDILLREWGILSSWLEQHRHFLAWRQTLEPRVNAWIQSNPKSIEQRDRGLLLYERDLEIAESWFKSYNDRLNTDWIEFVHLSLENRKQAVLERHRRQLVLRGLVITIFILLVSALFIFSNQNTKLIEQRDIANSANTQSAANASTAQSAVKLAISQEGTAIAERNIAVTAQAFAIAQQSEAEHQALISRSGELAAQAQIGWESHPERSILLEIEALRMIQSSQPVAEQALRDILSQTSGQTLVGQEGGVSALAISPDGRWLASGSMDNTVKLWDLSHSDLGASPLVLRGHEGGVRALIFSQDSRWLASGSDDKTVRLWDLKSPDPGVSPQVLRGHEDSVVSLTFSPDGRWLASGGFDSDNTVRLWDLKSPDPGNSSRVLRGHKDTVSALMISPDGRWLASGSWDNTVRLWDLNAPDPGATPQVLHGHESGVTSLAISPDGRWLASGSWDNTVRLWDLNAPDPGASSQVLRGHEGSVNTLAISSDGHWLASGSDDYSVRLWDLSAPDPGASSQVLRGHEGSVNTLVISPDGHWLASGSDDETVLLWDLSVPEPGAVPRVLRGLEGSVNTLVFSPDGRWLAGGSKDDTVRLWSLSTPDSTASPIVLRGDKNPVFCLAISQDGRWLASVGSDETVRLWDLRASDPGASPRVLRLHEDNVSSLAISPDGHWLAFGSYDNTVRLLDLSAPDPAISTQVLRGHEGSVTALAISADGRWLASGSDDKTVRLWDLSTPDPGASPRVLRVRDNFVERLAISADGRWLASGNLGTTVRLWDLSAADPTNASKVLRGHKSIVNALTFSSNGHWLASGSNDKTVLLWDLNASDPGNSPVALRGQEGSVDALAISPDGRWLASGSDDKTVRLWDLSASDPNVSPQVLRGHKDIVSALVFSPDGRWLASGSIDTTIRLWHMDSYLIDIACKVAGRNLSKGEWIQYLPWKVFDPSHKTCPQAP